jgi:hypothetical protein
MKKLTLIAFAIAPFLFSFQGTGNTNQKAGISKQSNAQDEKKLKVELTVAQWGAVIYLLDESNGPHPQVEAAKKLLLSQLTPQLDTAKKK